VFSLLLIWDAERKFTCREKRSCFEVDDSKNRSKEPIRVNESDFSVTTHALKKNSLSRCRKTHRQTRNQSI